MNDQLFPAPEPTLDEMVAEVEREIGKRAEVFPRWVAAGKMKQETSDYRMRCMRAVLRNLTAQKEGR